MEIVREFILCTIAAIFFAIVFKVPGRALLFSSVLGAVGYIFYVILTPLMPSNIASYFLATFLMAASSEIMARFLKMPATVFLIPAIIPLVPGIALYQTMYYLVQGDNNSAVATGAQALLAIIAMAMAIVIVAILTKAISRTVRLIANVKNQ